MRKAKLTTCCPHDRYRRVDRRSLPGGFCANKMPDLFINRFHSNEPTAQPYTGLKKGRKHFKSINMYCE